MAKKTVLTLLDLKGKFVQELELAVDPVDAPEVIRSLGKYYRKDVGEQDFPTYRETSFFWAHQTEYKPYIVIAIEDGSDGGGFGDLVGSFRTFKEALAAGKAVTRNVQIMDIRNTTRFYVDGSGWSDGRP